MTAGINDRPAGICRILNIAFSVDSCLWKMNKKDGYSQQNVRQRQKLISIIDYDVSMTFY